jgi:UDP-3-O-acyl-N-acetylglucosamine deacetylase
MKNQRTISKEVSFSGVGLHSGSLTTVTFKPAPPDTELFLSVMIWLGNRQSLLILTM